MTKLIALVALSAVLLAFVPSALANDPEGRGRGEDGGSAGAVYVPAQHEAPVLIPVEREGENQLAGI